MIFKTAPREENRTIRNTLLPATAKFAVCLLAVFACLSLMMSCSSEKPPRPEPAAADVSPADAGRQPTYTDSGSSDTATRNIEGDITAEGIAARNRFINEDIYFNYDSAELSRSARNILRTKADWLQAQPNNRIIIEGHCDERGTSEYNLALGDRRAESVKKYLITLGVAPSRMRTISYGEEKPAVFGTGEAAWSKNRRAHFEIR